MVSVLSTQLQDMVGELFLACDMPELPQQGFLKGLFGGGVRSLDREELCEYLTPRTRTLRVQIDAKSWAKSSV